jgi:hypothetical protein
MTHDELTQFTDLQKRVRELENIVQEPGVSNAARLGLLEIDHNNMRKMFSDLREEIYCVMSKQRDAHNALCDAVQLIASFLVDPEGYRLENGEVMELMSKARLPQHSEDDGDVNLDYGAQPEEALSLTGDFMNHEQEMSDWRDRGWKAKEAQDDISNTGQSTDGDGRVPVGNGNRSVDNEPDDMGIDEKLSALREDLPEKVGKGWGYMSAGGLDAVVDLVRPILEAYEAERDELETLNRFAQSQKIDATGRAEKAEAEVGCLKDRHMKRVNAHLDTCEKARKLEKEVERLTAERDEAVDRLGTHKERKYLIEERDELKAERDAMLPCVEVLRNFAINPKGEPLGVWVRWKDEALDALNAKEKV